MGIVVDKLNDDKETILRQNEVLPERISIASSLRDAFNGPSAAAAQQSLNSVDAANAIKVQIIAIGGNTGLLTTRYGASTSNITSQYGSIVSGVGTATGSSLGIVGLGSAIIAYGTINADVLKAYDYPKISNGNYGADYPFTGEGYVTVTSSNVGTGVSTKLFQSGGSELGKVFDIISPAVNVSSLIASYNSGISTVGSQTSVATAAQKIKGEYELQVWGLNRQLEENNERLAEINDALSQASDPGYGGPW